MNFEALRFWGMVVGAGLIAFAVFIAALGPEAPAASHPDAARAAQPDQPIAFVVRFRGGGPIARAQALAARGRIDVAQDKLHAQLQRQAEFAGLCFERFNDGATILRTCAPVVADDRATVAANWLSRLRDMPAVANADLAAADRAD